MAGMPSALLEELGDLVLSEHRHRLLTAPAHQRHALLPRHDLADEVTVDGLARERVDHDAGVGRRQRQEQRARRDRAERVEPEGLAERTALREHHDALAVDAEPDAGRGGQLDERRGDPALGGIVHRVHRGQLARDLGLRQDAEPRSLQEASGPADRRRRHAARPQFRLLFSCNDGRALQRHPLGHHDRVAHPRAPRRDQLVLLDFAEHRAGDDRPLETVRDLGVTADQDHPELVARRVKLGEQRVDRGVGGGASRQQQGRQEPPRARAADRDVVRVDVQRVPSDLGGRERDGVAGRDEISVAQVDDGGIYADAGHHRAVFSFLGDPPRVEAAALTFAARAVELIDMRHHRGIHPRVGALDVLPFVPLAGASMAETVALACRVGDALARRHAIPVYYYGDAARHPGRRTPRAVRRGEYEGLAARLAAADGAPDAGPARFEPRTGAVLVGARGILVAFNVWLTTGDVAVAREIARTVRESSGGLPAVQAMGVLLASRGTAQVSMNLLDYRATSIAAVFDRVRDEARARGVGVSRSELVGVAPRAAFAGRTPASVGLAGFTPG